MSTSGAPAIELSGLTKKFGDTTAVDQVDLTVNRGEFFCFLGPNGAGKTTTIKMITGLLQPTSGSVRVGGHDLKTELIEAKRVMAYVPDQPNVYERLSGREFLQFTADLWDVPRELRRTRMDELLELFGLTGQADDLAEGYSHGMKQKLVLASALLRDPKVIILDEPTVGLDPRSARIIKDVLLGLRDRGTTIFMSTHILEIAEKLCDRVGIIHRGKLIALGTVAELRRQAAGSSSLEDIFLQLTGATEDEHVARVVDAMFAN